MSITLIIGPMFSGKTSELIRLVDRKRIANKRCLILKHSQDTRFNHNDNDLSHVTTHSEIRYHKCDVVQVTDEEHAAIIDLIAGIVEHNKYDVVAIEEGHFFPEINEYCLYLANNGIEVIVSALDGSFKQELFTNIGKLIANSESVIKLTAVCMRCNNADASFNIRTNDSEQEILVGGIDMYQSVCRKCLNKHRDARIAPGDVS